VNKPTPRIILRSSCCGTVWIATVKVGNRVICETNAWGNAYNAKAEAIGIAAERWVIVSWTGEPT
jgi:hypothetical protein